MTDGTEKSNSSNRSSYSTVKEFADQWRVNPVTVRRWIQGSLLPAVRVGKSYRIPLSANPPNAGSGKRLVAAGDDRA